MTDQTDPQAKTEESRQKAYDGPEDLHVKRLEERLAEEARAKHTAPGEAEANPDNTDAAIDPPVLSDTDVRHPIVPDHAHADRGAKSSGD